MGMRDVPDNELVHDPDCPDVCAACRLIEARHSVDDINFEMWRRDMAGG